MSDEQEDEAAGAAPAVEYGKRKRAGLDEMIWVATGLSEEIAAGQRSLVQAGIRTEPYAPYMRRAEVCDDIATFLARIRPFIPELQRLMAAPPRKDTRGKA